MVDIKHNSESEIKYNPHDDTLANNQEAYISTDQGVNLNEKTDEPLFNWSAPDSFSVKKSVVWYLILIVVTIAIAGGIYLITKDKITTTVIVFCGLIIAIYGSKKPKTINYQITRYGFTVNGKYYPFANYKSFSVVNHGDGRSIVLEPLKRFMPYTYIYFEREMDQQITSIISSLLPNQISYKDNIDSLFRKIGF